MATTKFVQAQPFSIAGSGASIGDTTITLTSMLGIDGTTITTTDIGITGYGTLEPGNGSQEEAISFTGITQNANGTATLTGVSTVLFKSPYTATSGLAKTHAGASRFILSNDAAFYGNILNYVDSSLMASGIPATALVAGISKMSVAPVNAATAIAVGDNDPRMLSSTQASYVVSIINSGIPFVAATGTSIALTATLASSVSSLASGTALNILLPVTNATGVTLNVNSLGAKSIKKNLNVALASGDMVSGQVSTLAYDGANFQLLSHPATAFLGLVKVGTTTKDISSTTTTTIPHGLGVIPKLVRVSALLAGASSGTLSYAVSANATTISAAIDGGTNTSSAESTTFDLYSISQPIGNLAYNTGTIAYDATNITITWVKNNSPTGTANLLWEAIA